MTNNVRSVPASTPLFDTAGIPDFASIFGIPTSSQKPKLAGILPPEELVRSLFSSMAHLVEHANRSPERGVSGPMTFNIRQGTSRLDIKLDANKGASGEIEIGIESPAQPYTKHVLSLEAFLSGENLPVPIRALYRKLIMITGLGSSKSNPLANVTTRTASTADAATEAPAAVSTSTDTSEVATQTAAAPALARSRVYVLTRRDAPDLEFTGEELAACYSSWTMGRRREAFVFKTTSGKYVGVRVGRSLHASENPRVDHCVTADMAELVPFFGHDAMAKTLYGMLGINTRERIE